MENFKTKEERIACMQSVASKLTPEKSRNFMQEHETDIRFQMAELEHEEYELMKEIENNDSYDNDEFDMVLSNTCLEAIRCMICEDGNEEDFPLCDIEEPVRILKKDRKSLQEIIR